VRNRDNYISYHVRFEFNFLYCIYSSFRHRNELYLPSPRMSFCIHGSHQIFQLHMHHYLQHKHLSPIIHTRTYSIFKVMESSTISYNYLHIVNPGDQFNNLVAIMTHPKVLKHPNWHARLSLRYQKLWLVSHYAPSEFSIINLINHRCP